ncbi:hypothetical protein KCU71_g6666, partial [Aureobasidium melanogenum]
MYFGEEDLGESGHMQDSGVVVVNKWKHSVPLRLTARLNGVDRDGDKDAGKIGVYDMVYAGDKETFWLSWEMAGMVDYTFYSGSTGILGRLAEKKITHDTEQEDDESIKILPEQAENFTVCLLQLVHLDNA